MASSPDFRQRLASGKILFLDGGMGTMLQAAGMPPGVPPEEFCLNQPATLLKIQKEYAAAGADIITSCTFGANRFKLSPGLNVFEVNRKLVELAREAARAAAPDRRIYIAGDVGPQATSPGRWEIWIRKS